MISTASGRKIVKGFLTRLERISPDAHRKAVSRIPNNFDVPHQKECIGSNDQTCIFSTRKAFDKARIHPERDWVRCMFCDPLRLASLIKNHQRSNIVHALKQLYKLHHDVYEKALLCLGNLCEQFRNKVERDVRPEEKGCGNRSKSL